MAESSDVTGADFDGGTPPTVPEPLVEPESQAKWPTVVGWLSIIFGSLTLTCGSLGVVMALFMAPALMSMAVQKGDPPPTMTFSPLSIGLMFLGLLWQIPLVIAGILTLTRKIAGRPTHLLYAIGFALVTIPSTLVTRNDQIAYSKSPEIAQWKAENASSPLAPGLGRVPHPAWLLGGLTLNLAWPVFCLIWFLPAERSEKALRQDEEDALV